MIKPIIVILLISGLAACSTPQKQTLSAKEKVAGIEQMCEANTAAMKQRQSEKTLYSRLGGTEGINKFSSNLYQSHQSNEQIGHMFKNTSSQVFVNNVTEFLVAHSGGGGQYTGRTMTNVHQDLGITYDDFLAAGGDVQNVMKELGHGENEIQEAVCFLVSYIPQVVTK